MRELGSGLFYTHIGVHSRDLPLVLANLFFDQLAVSGTRISGIFCQCSFFLDHVSQLYQLAVLKNKRKLIEERI